MMMHIPPDESWSEWLQEIASPEDLFYGMAIGAAIVIMAAMVWMFI